jgi:hypothetical protein
MQSQFHKRKGDGLDMFDKINNFTPQPISIHVNLKIKYSYIQMLKFPILTSNYIIIIKIIN